MNKKLVSFISGLMLLFGCLLADSNTKFSEAYEETEIISDELFAGLSVAFSGKSVDFESMKTRIDKIISNCDTLVEAAREASVVDCAEEALQMKSYAERIREVLASGKHTDELIMLAARYYLHYNNCIMMKPVNLKMMLKDHVDELRSALEKKDFTEVYHLAEHLNIHANQMHYTAYIQGKMIWQKFSLQTKNIAGKIFVDAKLKNYSAIEKGIAEIDKPVSILVKIVNQSSSRIER
ncbi:MAG: hypothetical protein HQL32_04400 [Planctomycetes bacterium]|nr:hypothetical protein [Planctomycetota bacterium]